MSIEIPSAVFKLITDYYPGTAYGPFQGMVTAGIRHASQNVFTIVEETQPKLIPSNVFNIIISYMQETDDEKLKRKLKLDIKLATITVFIVAEAHNLDDNTENDTKLREANLLIDGRYQAKHFTEGRAFILKHVPSGGGKSIVIVCPHLMEKPIFGQIIAPFQTVVLRALSKQSIQECLDTLSPEQRARHRFRYQFGELTGFYSQLQRIYLETIQFHLSAEEVLGKLDRLILQKKNDPRHAMMANFKRTIGKVDCILSCLNISVLDVFTIVPNCVHYIEQWPLLKRAFEIRMHRLSVLIQKIAFKEHAEMLAPGGRFVYLDTPRFVTKTLSIITREALDERDRLFERETIEKGHWLVAPPPNLTYLRVHRIVLRLKKVS